MQFSSDNPETKSLIADNLTLNIAMHFIGTANVIHLVEIGSHIDLQEIKSLY